VLHPPTVSVLMPVYNAAPYLREAIDSIIAQTYTDLELIIVDDGSTDNSLEIIRSYMDQRIRVFAESHQGLVVTRNKGLSEARGAYIACMDADDISDPYRFAKQVTYLDAQPNVVVVGCWARVINPSGEDTGKRLTPLSSGRDLHVKLYAIDDIVNGSTMMRKPAVLAVGGYRAGFAPAEDYDLWFRLSEVGVLANIDEFLYSLRFHETSATARVGARGVDRCAALARKAALQRRLRGYDALGYAKPRLPQLTDKMDASAQIGSNMVTLGDWAHIYLQRGQLFMGNYILLRMLLLCPHDGQAWSVLRQCYGGSASLDTLSRAMRRFAWEGLGWIEAAHRPVGGVRNANV